MGEVCPAPSFGRAFFSLSLDARGRLRDPADRTDIVDFATATGPDQTHPRLLEFVLDHFRAKLRFAPAGAASPWDVRAVNRPGGAASSAGPQPLTDGAIYLQFHGHSKTVVGVEQDSVRDNVDAAGVHLLVLDPAWSAAAVAGSGTSAGWLRRFRVGLLQLRRRQYQLVVVRGSATPSERARGKLLESLRIEPTEAAHIDHADAHLDAQGWY